MKFEVLEPSIEDAKGSDPKDQTDFDKRFEILVYVRLPDGSFLWLPVARNASETKGCRIRFKKKKLEIGRNSVCPTRC